MKKRLHRIIVAALFALALSTIYPLPVYLRAATVAGCATLATTSNATAYTTGSFSPTNQDLLVWAVSATDTAAAGTASDSLGGGWTQVITTTKGASVDKLFLYIRNSLSDGTALTVTADVTGDQATGAVGQVFCVAGMSRVGSNGAALQTAVQANQGGGGTPAPAFASAALTGNPTLGFVANGTNPATVTEPTGWTEIADTGYATPATGGEFVARNSGFTGTTITWGGTSASAFGDIIVELDTSAAPAGSTCTGALSLLGMGGC